MPDLKILIEALEGQRKTAGELVAKAEAGTLTAEEKTSLESVFTAIETSQATIADERKIIQRKADLAKVDSYLNDPVNRVPHGAIDNHPSDQHKALTSAGWEVKAGVWYAPHSLEGDDWTTFDGHTRTHKKIALYAEDLLTGPMPDDPDAATYYRKTRATFHPDYRPAFTRFWRTYLRTKSEVLAMQALSPSEQKALSEGVDTAGGYLVPPDLQAEVLARLPMASVMRQRARVVTTSRDLIRWPMVQPNATNGSIYSSGFVGDWAGETPAFTDVDPKFGIFELAIKKARAATKLSNDLLADAVYNPLAFLASDGAMNLGLVEDNGFVAGNGGSLQPSGVLISGAATVDIAGTTAHTISNTSTDLGSAPKLITLQGSVPMQYQPGASFLMHRLTNVKIRQLVTFQGQFIWAQGFAPIQSELLGKPLAMSDFLPQDGTAANKVVVYGDFSAYIIGQRAQVSVSVLRERFADTDQTGIILWERVGGGTWNVDAFRIGIVS